MSGTPERELGSNRASRKQSVTGMPYIVQSSLEPAEVVASSALVVELDQYLAYV